MEKENFLLSDDGKTLLESETFSTASASISMDVTQQLH